MISTGNCSAMSKATVLLPLAVGPMIKMALGKLMKGTGCQCILRRKIQKSFVGDSQSKALSKADAGVK